MIEKELQKTILDALLAGKICICGSIVDDDIDIILGEVVPAILRDFELKKRE